MSPRSIALALTLLAALLPHAPAAQPRAVDPPFLKRFPRWRAGRALMAQADTLASHGRFAAADAYLDSLVAVARGRRDTTLWVQTLVRRGGGLVYQGDLRRGEPMLLEAGMLSKAAGDSVGELNADRWLAYAAQQAGRFARGDSLWRRSVTQAARVGDRASEGWARMGLAFTARERGALEQSRRDYARAIELFREADIPIGLVQAQVGLARVAGAEGRTEEFRLLHLRALADARRIDNLISEGQILHNLGVYEESQGDAGLAMRYLQLSLERTRRAGVRGREGATTTEIGLANLQLQLGRLDDAFESFRRIRNEALVLGQTQIWINASMNLMDVEHARGRFDRVFQLIREAEARRDSLPPSVRNELLTRRADALVLAGRPREAAALVEPLQAARSFGLDGLGDESAATKVAANIELALGRPRSALGIVRRARTRGVFADGAAVARVWMALDRADSALVSMRAFMERMERRRVRHASIEWRSVYGSRRGSSAVDFAQIAFAAAKGAVPERWAAAYDALQPHRATNLLDATARAGEQRRPVATVALLQARVLRDGELLLDAVGSADTTLVFAITRSTVRVYGLPGAPAMWARFTRLGALLESAEPDPAVLEQASRGVRQLVFGPVADLISRSRVVLLCGDSGFDRMPTRALFAGDADPTCAIAVSSTLLMRARLETRPPAERTMLAIGGDRDGSGRELSGAQREANWLARTFRGADAALSGRERTAAALAPSLSRYGVLHFAGHAEMDRLAPWRQGIRLGDGAGPDAYLRASTLAGMPLRARLGVLSSCESIGMARGSEGLEGLTGALLRAGVSTVVSTLWDVEDAMSVRFSERFYEELAAGRSVADALRRTQDHFRKLPATRGPRHWAGYVVVGDPETRVPLAREKRFLPMLRRP